MHVARLLPFQRLAFSDQPFGYNTSTGSVSVQDGRKIVTDGC